MQKKTVEYELFSFDELESDAQDRARENWYQRQMDDFEFHMECFVDPDNWPTILKALGFTQNTRRAVLMSGRTVHKPDFQYSFGGGPEFVSFDGTWMPDDFDRDAVEEIRKDRPTDTRLHSILDDAHQLWVVAGQGDLYTIKGETDRRGWDVELEERAQDDDGETIESDDVSHNLLSLCHDLDVWMTRQVNDELKYQTSDEALTEWANREGDGGCIFLSNGETL